MSHNTLSNYYRSNFALIQHHKWSLTELDNLIPFEKEIYMSFLNEYLENLEKQQKSNQ